MREWDSFISDKLGNNLLLTDPDRANRLHKAAENGADGSTHAEQIEDWREFLFLVFLGAREEKQDLLFAIEDEIDAKEEELDKKGVLDNVIG